MSHCQLHYPCVHDVKMPRFPNGLIFSRRRPEGPRSVDEHRFRVGSCSQSRSLTRTRQQQIDGSHSMVGNTTWKFDHHAFDRTLVDEILIYRFQTFTFETGRQLSHLVVIILKYEAMSNDRCCLAYLTQQNTSYNLFSILPLRPSSVSSITYLMLQRLEHSVSKGYSSFVSPYFQSGCIVRGTRGGTALIHFLKVDQRPLS
jgi:hypothetical protein